MPFMGEYTQETYAQQMIDEYMEAGVPPSEVWPQSFLWEDVHYGIENTANGDQAAALDENDNATNDEIDVYLHTLVENNV